MNFDLNQEHKLIQKTSRDFATNELLPEVLKRDENIFINIKLSNYNL